MKLQRFTKYKILNPVCSSETFKPQRNTLHLLSGDFFTCFDGARGWSSAQIVRCQCVSPHGSWDIDTSSARGCVITNSSLIVSLSWCLCWIIWSTRCVSLRSRTKTYKLCASSGAFAFNRSAQLKRRFDRKHYIHDNLRKFKKPRNVNAEWLSNLQRVSERAESSGPNPVSIGQWYMWRISDVTQHAGEVEPITSSCLLLSGTIRCIQCTKIMKILR